MIDRVDLDVMRFETRVKCTEAFFAMQRDEIFNKLLLSLEMRLVGEHQEPFKYELPASWWQQFKQEVFPHWLLKRFPVKLITKELSLSMIYPHIKCALPKKYMGDIVCLMIHNSPARYIFDPNEPVNCYPNSTCATKKPL